MGTRVQVELNLKPLFKSLVGGDTLKPVELAQAPAPTPPAASTPSSRPSFERAGTPQDPALAPLGNAIKDGVSAGMNGIGAVASGLQGLRNAMNALGDFKETLDGLGPKPTAAQPPQSNLERGRQALPYALQGRPK